MDNNSVKFKRIFIHELGHLVAHEIDSKIYTNIPPVKAIKIYPCLEDSEELCAEIVRNFPEGLNENTLTPRERVAYSLAGSSHGCIFEAYFLKSSIIKCFENHGEKDQCKFNGELIRLGIFYKIEIFNQIIYDYWNELKNDDILSHFINLDPQNFILEDDSSIENIEVDIVKLREEIKTMVVDYKPYYLSLIGNFENLIEAPK